MEHKFLILDLDNCISDDEWRVPMINWEHQDLFQRFHTYHIHAFGDRAENTHLFSAEPPVVIMTGRPFAYWRITTRWLQHNHIPYVALFMRPDGDCHVPAPEVKRQQLYRMYGSMWAGPADIVCAYDDRQDIVAMYRAEGLNAERVYITERTVR